MITEINDIIKSIGVVGSLIISILLLYYQRKDKRNRLWVKLSEGIEITETKEAVRNISFVVRNPTERKINISSRSIEYYVNVKLRRYKNSFTLYPLMRLGKSQLDPSESDSIILGWDEVKNVLINHSKDKEIIYLYGRVEDSMGRQYRSKPFKFNLAKDSKYQRKLINRSNTFDE